MTSFFLSIDTCVLLLIERAKDLGSSPQFRTQRTCSRDFWVFKMYQ